MIDDTRHDEDSGHDHPQTIDAEPLEQTRSARLLEEQQGKEPGDAAGAAEADANAGGGDPQKVG